jgi:hypothetical protein
MREAKSTQGAKKIAKYWKVIPASNPNGRANPSLERPERANKRIAPKHLLHNVQRRCDQFQGFL